MRTIDAAQPKAIGLDFVFDRPTELSKDEELLQSIRDARTPVVLGLLGARSFRSDRERTFQAQFLAAANRPTGHLYFDGYHGPLVISDHVVRFHIGSYPGEPVRQSFAELLATAAGASTPSKSPYISWLLMPRDGTETFLTVPAEHVLAQGGLPAPLPLEQLLHDRIVLIGGNFADRDQHLIPLSVTDERRYQGLFIHARIVAQLLDRRSIWSLGWPFVLASIALAAAGGFWVGRKERLEHFHLLIELLSIAVLIVISVVVFVSGGLIFPFVSVLLGWLAGVTGGVYSRWASQ